MGPYDKRLGYALLPAMLDRLTSKGYAVIAQARMSPTLCELIDRGLFPIYHEKTQAGLTVIDQHGEIISATRYPERVYVSFDSIPALIVNTLLFIENRDLLDPQHPYRNPAVEWDRFAKAAFDKAVQMVDRDHKGEGGSTLATQIEKFRHSPEGRTTSVLEKVRQMGTATFRAYLNGEETMEARRQVILNYINSVPLAALPGYGEVNGLGDGLWAWYRADVDTVNELLRECGPGSTCPDVASRALAYKQVLSLFIAHRRPSDFLVENHDALESLTNTYLHLMADAGVITAEMRDAALGVEFTLNKGSGMHPQCSFLERKTATTVRTDILTLLGIPSLYDLDRLDLTVKSTVDYAMDKEMTRALRDLLYPDRAGSAGLYGERLLEPENVGKVIYSITLYERVQDANLLRIQADNLDQPLNINEGVKLELGSTAKLRTLITYLEIVEELHTRYAGLAPDELRTVPVPRSDGLTQWAVEYLLTAKEKSLPVMLDAAMKRMYSANPWEGFFTGGGLHTFANFNEEDNEKITTVEDAFHNSINLVFIRLMRDIVRYYMYQVPGSTAKILEDTKDPRRREYLSQFADQEGREFLNRFYRKYQGKGPDEAFALLLSGVRLTPARLATVFRSVDPVAGLEAFAAFMTARLPNSDLTDKELRGLYERYSPGNFSLADRGYIAHVHPLELWVVGYVRSHPGAGRAEIVEASAGERQEVYTWLFSTHRKQAQDTRIRTLIEVEAFQEIHQAWKRLGYPFDSLVPSYATAIGSSSDRPAALAELVGIIMNDGIRYPVVRVEEMHFAEGTPYETMLRPEIADGERVLSPEIAATVRKALTGVVENGTAVRIRNVFHRSDGSPLMIAGKTGTGDNRYEVFGRGGVLIESRVVNRTAAFVFMIGDRFFGTITAYVAGPDAGRCGFTSSLPLQVLKALAPKLMPLIERPAECVPANPSLMTGMSTLP